MEHDMNKQTPYEQKEIQIIHNWVIECLAYLGYHDYMHISVIQSPSQLLISTDCDGINQIRYDDHKVFIVNNKLQIKQFTIKNNKLWLLQTITVPDDMCLETAIQTIIQYHRLNIK
jgi:hypothetical protein